MGLAGDHEVVDRAEGLLERHRHVVDVRVQQVDAVWSQPSERVVDGADDGVSTDPEQRSELGSDHDVIAAPAETPSSFR